MKILFDHANPFMLAHGGFQIQIEQTKAALERRGLAVEFLRWWDAQQRGDLIHFFGLPHPLHPKLAHKKNIRFVVSQLLGGLGARTGWQRSMQKVLIGLAGKILPPGALDRTGWSVWQVADAYIAVTSWEAQLMRDIFGAPNERVHVIPNAVSDVFFDRQSQARGDLLVTTASIFPVKRLVETARAAIAAQTPYLIIGRPLSEADDYFRQFTEICQAYPQWIRHDKIQRSHAELAEIYRKARGFVLLSHWESQSLAALEAAAAECPLLISDLPWARATFGEGAMYCPIAAEQETAEYLKGFYEQAPSLPLPPKPATWDEIATKLARVYETVLAAK